MHPDLISIGFLHVRTYGAFMAIGFLMGWWVLGKLCRRSGRSPDPIGNLLMLLVFCGVLGSRIAYVIEHWQSEFAAHPELIIRIDQGGLMFYGGLILALVVFVVWGLVKRERLLPIADMLAVAVPLGHAFGRVGCFFYGCCYGRLSQSAWAVSFPRMSPAWYEQVNRGLITSDAPAALTVLPTQLFEAAALIILFVVLLVLYRRFAETRVGLLTGSYLAGYACIRYGIEFLRGDPRAEVGPFSISQAISLALFLLGSAFISVAFLRKKL